MGLQNPRLKEEHKARILTALTSSHTQLEMIRTVVTQAQPGTGEPSQGDEVQTVVHELSAAELLELQQVAEEEGGVSPNGEDQLFTTSGAFSPPQFPGPPKPPGPPGLFTDDPPSPPLSPDFVELLNSLSE